MEKWKKFIEKVKEHKKEIIIAGVTIVVIAGAIIVVNKLDLLDKKELARLLKIKSDSKTKLIPILKEVTQEVIVVESHSSSKIIDVCSHLRNLPEGCAASADRVASAIVHGYELGERQTWVIDYSKTCA